MAKTKKADLQEAEETLETSASSEEISFLQIDLGRDDLNRVVAKINEVIEKVNKK